MLQKKANDLRVSHTEDVLNDCVEDAKAQMLNKACQQVEDFRNVCASHFPLVKEFFKEVVNAGRQLKIGEMPCLMGPIEKPEGKHGSVYRNVKSFVESLERYCASQGINLDFEHEKCMPSLLGKQYRVHYESKLVAASGTEELVTWEMVKGWLEQYIDTPKQRIANIKVLLNLSPREGENGCEFVERVRDALSSTNMKQFTVDEFFFAALCGNLGTEWKHKVGAAVNGSSSDVMKKGIDDMLTMVSNLDLVAERKRRYDHNQGEGAGKRGRFVSPSNGTGTSKWAKPQENSLPSCRRCGRVWVPGHKEVCPKLQRGNGSQPQVNRMASLVKPAKNPSETVGDEDLDQVIETLVDDMEISDLEDDKMSCKHKKNKERELVHFIDGETDVPIYVESVAIRALVDSGANFSSLNKSFCITNNIPILKYVEGRQPIIRLASAESTIKCYGYTPELRLKYNGKSYTFKFEVMNLAFEKPMSIGTDLMKVLGIGYYGLATSWDPPSMEKLEEPFKDLPKPNEDPFGTPSERNALLDSIQESIHANESIPFGTFCTHPDAIVYLDTPESAACYKSQYPIADMLKPKVQETVEKWLSEGIITEVPSNVDNKWNSPLTMAPKKDLQGNYTDKRPCLDPRHINKLLKEDRFPLPKISDIFKDLQGANVFTTLDLKNAFHRFPIYAPHQHKTAFTSVDGKQYMFRGCPFGLKPISSKFQRVMSKLFKAAPFRSYVSTFVDDIVIYSRDMQEHTTHVKSVINELTRVKLILNPTKCHFAQRTIYLLGFCVSANGQTYLDPRKVANTMEWPTPRTGKDIQRFLGLVNYFREYVPKISILTAKLDGLRNHAGNLGSLWTEKHDQAFHNLKQALLHAPILQPPNLDLPFQVATDASDVGIGAAGIFYEEASVHRLYGTVFDEVGTKLWYYQAGAASHCFCTAEIPHVSVGASFYTTY